LAGETSQKYVWSFNGYRALSTVAVGARPTNAISHYRQVIVMVLSHQPIQLDKALGPGFGLSCTGLAEIALGH
jgi:hypothetical protein